MLLNEFIERTGFTPTEECYHTHIEPGYMRSKMDKDEWCRQWKKNGGIATAYEWQAARTQVLVDNRNDLRRKLSEAEKTIQRLEGNLETKASIEDERNTLAAGMAKMKVFLIEQAEKCGSTDLRSKAIELMGAKEYIAYKLEHEMNLWQLDKDLIIELLNK